MDAGIMMIAQSNRHMSNQRHHTCEMKPVNMGMSIAFSGKRCNLKKGWLSALAVSTAALTFSHSLLIMRLTKFVSLLHAMVCASTQLFSPVVVTHAFGSSAGPIFRSSSWCCMARSHCCRRPPAGLRRLFLQVISTLSPQPICRPRSCFNCLRCPW